MKLENPIGWCDETTNAVTGCAKVSPGCKNCYAEAGTRARVLRHQGIETWGPKGIRHPVAEFATKVRRLNKLCICDRCHETHRFEEMLICDGVNVHCHCGPGKTLRRIRLFADSNSDWLDDKWPVETLAAFLKEIHDAPNVDFQLLTKRPENYFDRIRRALEPIANDADKMDKAGVAFINAWTDGDEQIICPPNVWLGVSAENQEWADKRIPVLLKIPAEIRFLSCEPLLGQITLPIPSGASTENQKFPDDFDKRSKSEQETWFTGTARAIFIARCSIPFQWVIVGAESGPNRRIIAPSYITNIADQCVAAGIPVYVKQANGLKSGEQGRIPDAYWKLKQFPK